MRWFLPVGAMLILASPAFSKDAMPSTEGARVFLGWSIIGIAFAFLYFIPSLVGRQRKHPNLAPIFIVNIFLGWSLIGWTVALAWSFSALEKDTEETPNRKPKSTPDDPDNPFSF